jgi:hypothetical protein
MHNVLLTMRQVLQLLIVNSTQPTGQTLTEASQVFSRTDTNFADVPQAIITQNRKVSVQTQLTDLQHQLNVLKGYVHVPD